MKKPRLFAPAICLIFAIGGAYAAFVLDSGYSLFDPNFFVILIYSWINAGIGASLRDSIPDAKILETRETETQTSVSG